MQFDFQPRRGMVGVTCSVTAEDMSAFEQRMAGAFGEQQRASDGSRRWQLGGYSVGSVEVVVLGKTLRDAIKKLPAKGSTERKGQSW